MISFRVRYLAYNILTDGKEKKMVVEKKRCCAGYKMKIVVKIIANDFICNVLHSQAINGPGSTQVIKGSAGCSPGWEAMLSRWSIFTETKQRSAGVLRRGELPPPLKANTTVK